LANAVAALQRCLCYARAANTNKRYAAAHAIFFRFCEQFELNRYVVPTDIQTALLCFWFCLQYSFFSFDSFLSAVQNWFRSLDGAATLVRGSAFRDCHRLCRNLFSEVDEPHRMDLLDPTSIKTLISHLSATGSVDALSLATLISFGFWGMFRRDELLAIAVQDLQFTADAVHVKVHYSKTDPRPVVVPLFARSDITCPRSLALRLLQTRKQFGIRSAFFFVSDKAGSHFTTNILTSRFLKAIAIVFPKSIFSFSIHSLRRSGASALHAAGVRDSVIMHIGRWKSASSFRLYAIVAPVAVHEAYRSITIT